MDTKIRIIAVAILILAVVGVVFAYEGGLINTNPTSTAKVAVNQSSTENTPVKEITIGIGSDGYYTPKDLRIKVGDRVRLSGDANTMKGCMKTVIIQNYGSVTAGGTPLEFVADKAGTFRMTCPMGMGSGQLIVEDASGSVPGGIVPLSAPARSGGCGCGG